MYELELIHPQQLKTWFADAKTMIQYEKEMRGGNLFDYAKGLCYSHNPCGQRISDVAFAVLGISK